MAEQKHPTYPPTIIAKLLMLTERRLQQLAKEGIIPKTERGRYELAPTVQSYIKYIRDRKAANPDGSPSTIDFNFEKSRKMRAEADIAEAEAEKLKGNLVTAEEVSRAIQEDYLYIKQRLRTIPSRVAAILIAAKDITEIKEILITEIDDILNELSNEFILEKNGTHKENNLESDYQESDSEGEESIQATA